MLSLLNNSFSRNFTLHLSELTIISSLRYVKDVVKQYHGLTKVPITRDLLKSVNGAYQKYNLRLQQNKKQEEEEKKKEAAEEQRKKEEAEKLEKAKESSANLKQKDKKLDTKEKEALLSLIQNFVLAIDDVVTEETQNWAKEFESSLTELNRSALSSGG